MADNDRFIIVVPKESEIIDDFYFVPIAKTSSDLKIKAEYEKIILEVIHKEIDVVLNGRGNVTIKTLAKAVVDRLFGEGE